MDDKEKFRAFPGVCYKCGAHCTPPMHYCVKCRTSYDNRVDRVHMLYGPEAAMNFQKKSIARYYERKFFGHLQRMKTDPVYREEYKKKLKERHNYRMANDPEYKARILEHGRIASKKETRINQSRRYLWQLLNPDRRERFPGMQQTVKKINITEAWKESEKLCINCQHNIRQLEGVGWIHQHGRTCKAEVGFYKCGCTQAALI